MCLKFWSVAPVAACSRYPSSGLQVCTYSVWRVFYRIKKNKQSPCYKLSQLQGVSPGHAVLPNKKGFILGKLKSMSAGETLSTHRLQFCKHWHCSLPSSAHGLKQFVAVLQHSKPGISHLHHIKWCTCVFIYIWKHENIAKTLYHSSPVLASGPYFQVT